VTRTINSTMTTSTSRMRYVLLSITLIALMTPLVVSFSSIGIKSLQLAPYHAAFFGPAASQFRSNTIRKRCPTPLHVVKDASLSTLITTINARRPQVHWTVPGMNLAYQNATTGEWSDVNGPRDGPPRNYWRQSSDEKIYKRDIDLIDAALLANLNNFDSIALDEMVKAAEKRGGARFPWISRKLLGTWAPILHAGEKVVCESYNTGTDDDDDDATGESAEQIIECSTVIEIQRSAGPKYAPKNYYGTFYANLEEDEEIRVLSSDLTIDDTIRVSKANTTIVMLEDSESVGNLAAPVYLGRITYLSDYILIQRRSDGSVDLWLRMDESYLGNLDADADTA